MNHTPGLWHAASYNNKAGDNDVCDEKGRLIAEVTNWEETEANELLIAAAPEMLEALRYALHVIEGNGMHRVTDRSTGWPNLVSMVNAVIAKAEGE